MLIFNENNETIAEEETKAILVGVCTGGDISCSMEELEALAEAAGAEVLGVMVQNEERPNRATMIGSGKVKELAEARERLGADTVIFNDELTGAQIRNIEDAVGARVIDRTILILDIFARRATSKEGKLQVELAQLAYRLPRLTGFGKSLSRLGGGIGTRGPGETKLETDRRHIDRRMDDIKRELAQLSNTRSEQRKRRAGSGIPIVALVGYTNAGKSALMNRLLAMSDKEEKSVTEQDMLFATLDVRHRSISLEGGREFILADTVGFVSGLPHALVEAFKGTLEETKYADLLLHVVDLSRDDHDFQMEVTERVLREIGAGDRDKIVVYNKCDAAGVSIPQVDAPDSVYVSALTGENIDVLLGMIKDRVFADRITATLLVPYTKGDVTSYLCEKTRVISMDYTEEGTKITAELTRAEYGRFRQYGVVQDGRR